MKPTVKAVIKNPDFDKHLGNTLKPYIKMGREKDNKYIQLYKATAVNCSLFLVSIMLKYSLTAGCLWLLIMLVSVNCRFQPYAAEEMVAKKYCSSCHRFPEPALLDKNTWQASVLPQMATRLGIMYHNGEPIPDVYGISSKQPSNTMQLPAVSIKDWKKIVQYYTALAPEKPPAQNRPAIQQTTSRFAAKPITYNSSFPSATFVKIDKGNRNIYAGSAADSLLFTYHIPSGRVVKNKVDGYLIDMEFEENLQLAGNRTGIYTNIGIMHPNNLKRGSIHQFQMSASGELGSQSQLVNQLPRPVQTKQADFNQDGRPDYLVCGFGNDSGAFYIMQSRDNMGFEQKMIRPLPGAVKAYVDDYNKDGKPDIMALFAQGQEGIFLFINKGDGLFDEKEIIGFPPVYGSSYFEVQDMNGDGLKDIIYTCGDNADLSSQVLKNYHGVYIYINKGNYVFEQQFFFPINGCYKAVAKDFDLDGDNDLACISYFPDVKNQPQESFVYLENKGSFHFDASTIQDFNKGHWIAMDVDDADGDGDEDIVIGSLMPPDKIDRTAKKEAPKQPDILLLLNTTR